MHSEFDPSLINFGPMVKNSYGSDMCYLSYGDKKQPIYLQTPVNMYCPFGVSQKQWRDQAEKSVSIVVAFRNVKTDPKMAHFCNKVIELDSIIRSKAAERGWSNTRSYRPLIDLKPTKYSRTMQVKIPFQKGTTTAEIYSESKQKVNLDYITKNSTVCCLLKLKCVWFMNDAFGVTWNLTQVCVTSQPQKSLVCPVKEVESDKAALRFLDM